MEEADGAIEAAGEHLVRAARSRRQQLFDGAIGRGCRYDASEKRADKADTHHPLANAQGAAAASRVARCNFGGDSHLGDAVDHEQKLDAR